MKKIIVLCLFALITLSGCGSKNVQETAIPQDKVYNVVFEGDPEITDKRVFSSSDFEIGEVLQETSNNSDLTLVKISIKEVHTPLIRSNLVFVATDGHLKAETVGEKGEALSEGGQLLGFTGKTKLLWFKAKSKVTGFSKAAKNKASELYNKVAK